MGTVPLSKRLRGAERPNLRADGRPLYIRAQDGLRHLISSLELEPGERLPGEPTLARLLGISRPTVREALRHLELNSEVRRIQGRGTLVTQPRGQIVAGLETLESLESLARRQGWSCHTTDVLIERVPLERAAAEALAAAPGCTAVRLLRTKHRDGTAIAVMESLIPTTIISASELREEFEASVIDTILRRGKPVLDHARARLLIDQAAGLLATRLRVEPGSALLLLEEVFYDPAATPFCFNRNWFVPGSLRLELVRRPR
jgi:GntR family transcriptional regulator